MDYLNELIGYAEGKITHEEFESNLYIHPEIWNEIQNLVPADINDEDCEFRSTYGNMQGLETNNYNVKSFLLAFSYNPLKTYGLISALIKYNYPFIECREPLKESDIGLLEKTNMDYIGGPEIDDIVQAILRKKMSYLSIKKCLKQVFPCRNNKRPKWIQEPEWPMGTAKPMRFISQSREGDLFKYVFEDLDTGELRTIIQLA